MSTPELKPNMTISQGSMLAPGIVSLFIQGLEAGLVITQFLKWLSRWEGGERSWIVVLVFFVTLVGFVQTGVIFASVWRDYVQNFGQPIYPRWTESIQIALTLLMAAPVQSFLIWRCHHVVKLSYYVTTLLVAALIGSLVLAVWVSTHIIIINSAGLKQKNLAGVWYPLLLYNTLPSLLDLSLNVILLSYLMRSLNRVYTVHARRRINRLMVVSWQAALPPSISSLVTMITYIIYVTVYPVCAPSFLGSAVPLFKPRAHTSLGVLTQALLHRRSHSCGCQLSRKYKENYTFSRCFLHLTAARN
ncbi:hypothetical protein BC834DRAFT_305042 [Gloeopeniophorella convolvens]|nr:hypothetical protein BC834DRAFT_305042 [Gloeopeniophorella convolvens]